MAEKSVPLKKRPPIIVIVLVLLLVIDLPAKNRLRSRAGAREEGSLPVDLR
jgi:hypothetical protein